MFRAMKWIAPVAGLALVLGFNQLSKAADEAPAGKATVSVTISCGLAEFSAGDSRRTLVGRADQALYDAKKKGKHRVATKALPLIRDMAR